MAALTARLGDLDRAEEALSEAALRAHRSWAATIPANPSGWLYRVALNAATDVYRREARRTIAAPDLAMMTETDTLDVTPKARLDLLRHCADPVLSQEQQIALMLFHLAGLDCATIARAFLVRESAVHQRLSRARAKLRQDVGPRANGSGGDGADLSAVRAALEVIYLQSYRNIGGGVEAAALGRDALQLAQALCEAGPDEAESWALIALLHLLEARRPARLSTDRVFVPLNQQDALQWSAGAMQAGAAAMQRVAAIADRPEPYAVRAQIELTRMAARQQNRSCDRELLSLYDLLTDLVATPFAAIDRALVLSRLDGPQAGLTAFEALDTDLSGHAGWHLAKAEFHDALGDVSRARLHMRSALTLIDGPAERAFVEAKLRALPS